MEGESVAIDIGSPVDYNAWMDSMRSRIMESSKFNSFFIGPGIVIPRISDDIRRGSNNSYHPKLVSIGPYHNGKDQLQAMEEYKRQCLKDLLARNSTLSLERCIEAMREVEAEAKRCYPENRILSNDDLDLKFVEMMLLDASFIIEVFMKQRQDRLPSYIYSLSPLIKRDLLLLENQLPFFVIQRLFDLTLGDEASKENENENIPSSTSPPKDSLTELAIYFFYSSHGEKGEIRLLPANLVHHLLHLYQYQFYPDIFYRQPRPISSIPGAKKLHVMGIDFKVASSKSILTDVKFNVTNKDLEIPHLFIAEDTIAVFLNLIALEQSNVRYGTSFTSYAVFISNILSEAVDVEFLCEKGIIEHRLGNQEEVVLLFRSMCSGLTIDPHVSSLGDVLRSVNSYSKDHWNIWKASLTRVPWWRNYTKDPITVAALFCGGIGIWILTFLATFYTIYSYYNHRS